MRRDFALAQNMCSLFRAASRQHSDSNTRVMASLSNYAVRMARLSARIFGDVARPTDNKSMKVVQLFKEPPMAQKKEVYDWYPQHKIYYALTQKLRYMGLFRDEHEDFKEEMRRLRKLRGKGKPKKGEGKRATKKK
ncbi:28S ribosomal protein S33, mitochondrial-like isoform X1 [Oncorhynchus kisutch]|uniref:28S ribosomal protein S33, mitochondrial-like isoform X1 n=1 Tax=Oncorhynchus kisutch TaxID=8019 RepID=UPI0012DE253C|nr:28S ribosomal protein S33, mitochondrial-like isoform X1 [Oncorhynchus kisutch]XP_031674550.1 28S ribosomal protein S33, mitochondrial-like isoform X1 [Oncorhynchus kisutch]